MATWQQWLYGSNHSSDFGARHLGAAAARSAVAAAPALEHVRFTGEFGTLEARLFVPSDHKDSPPLLLMLHGCGQTAEEFAIQTGMAEHAESAGFIVLFAAQSMTRNRTQCWNWFDPEHQHRGAGEPALLADAVCQTISARQVDRSRVYVAGLSAGGAMAVTLGRSYPDIFAAVGCHSGLAHGSADDALGALDVMRHGPPEDLSPLTRGVPTIVFHDANDDVVHFLNARRVIADCLGRPPCEGDLARDSHGRSPVIPRIFRDARGQHHAEYWEVIGAGHAWSNGCPEPGFTELTPNASLEMLRFFQAHALRPRLVADELLHP